jgi:hypothetical membrane protein
LKFKLLKYLCGFNFIMTVGNGKIAGTLLIVGGAQFIIALIIAEAIYPGYSIADNYISDLGVWGNPSALVFNPSIMLFGAAALAASIYIKRHFHLNKMFILYAIAGAGSLGVGLFPENTFAVAGIPVLHSISALLAFVFGGIAAIATYKLTRSPFRYLSAIVGVDVLVTFAVFLVTRDFGALGIGRGGLERLVAYPSILGFIAFGGYLLADQAQSEP